MKNILGFLVLSVAFMVSCSDEKSRYIDLRTGENITVEKDPETGAWINTETKEPVYIYVDTKSGDTIYGRTGVSINGQVVKSNEVWYYEADLEGGGESKIKIGDDYKKKVDEDGDVKIKSGDQKVKIDGETGERKVKNDD